MASGCGTFSCINNNLSIQKSSFSVLTMELLMWTYSSLGPITSVRLTLRLGVVVHACTHRLGSWVRSVSSSFYLYYNKGGGRSWANKISRTGDERAAFLAGSKMEVTFVTQEGVGTFWHFIWSNDYHCLERSFPAIPRSRLMALSCFRLFQI